MLERAGVEAGRVTYVPADFQVEDWFEKLRNAGFKPDRGTFFLWESVTMYLEKEAVTSTLRKIAGTAPGSVVALDYFSDQMMRSRTLFMSYVRVVLNALGEPLGTFGIDNTPPARDRVAAFLESCGLLLREYRTFGQETGRKRAAAGFVVAIVPSAAGAGGHRSCE